MDLMHRRRMMMLEMTASPEEWDYVFTKSQSGYYEAIPVSVTAGQIVTIEFAPSTASNGYIYYGKGTVTSPNSQRANTQALKAGGTLIKEITGNGTLYFGTSNTGSTYYSFNGDYIKVRIE